MNDASPQKMTNNHQMAAETFEKVSKCCQSDGDLGGTKLETVKK